MKIRLNGIVEESIVDGIGIRYVIFTQGCFHNCFECHNKETHSLDGGYIEDIKNILNNIQDNPLLDGVTFSGGEPFLQIEPLIEIALYCKEIGLDIWIYSGYLYEELYGNKEYIKLLKLVDVLVDGKFISSEKFYDLKFQGSKNQRIIDVQKSFSDNSVVLYDLKK